MLVCLDPVRRLAASIAIGLLACEPAAAQTFPAFLIPGLPWQQRSPERVSAARESWSAAEHASAVTSAVAVTDTLPEPLRTTARLQLAAILDQLGDQAAEGNILREAAAQTPAHGPQVRELAQRLASVGAAEAAKALVTKASDTFQKQQVSAGILDGALKAGNLDLALEALNVARRLPRQAGTYDPLSSEAKTLAAALAKAHRFKEALATYPRQNFGQTDLPTLARQACAADPALADDAGRRLATSVLEAASAHYVARAPTDEIQAIEACQGAAAARALVAVLPRDVAEKVAILPATIADPEKLAFDAAQASAGGDRKKADQLFDKAKVELATAAAARGISADARRRFDTAAKNVALLLLRAGRPDAAASLVGDLPALERLPILFDLAEAAVRTYEEPSTFLDPINAAFSALPALIEIEASDIRALRGALPLGSPSYPSIETWSNKLAPEPQPSVPPITRGTRLGDPPDRFLNAILGAAEKVAPSMATMHRVLDEAKRGEISQSIIDAKAMTLTSREVALLEISRDFFRALPEDLLAPYKFMVESGGLDSDKGAAAVASADLLLAVEQSALARGDVTGARDSLEAIDHGSSARVAGVTMLAIAEASSGLPRQASVLLTEIKTPQARAAVFEAIAAVMPMK